MASNKPVILIMGPSGTGKTRFTNLAAGASTFEEGSGLEATTRDAQSVEILLDGRVIEVFDTPGPDGDERCKAKADLLQLFHDLDRRDIVGIVYMHDISQNRASKPTVDSYKWLQETCGRSAMRNLVIVTTMWDCATRSGTDHHGYYEGRERELQYGEPCYKTAFCSGASLRRHNDTQESALAILRLVASKPPMKLQCQVTLNDGEEWQSINTESTRVDRRYDQKAQTLEGRHGGGCFGLLRRHKHHGKSKGGGEL